MVRARFANVDAQVGVSWPWCKWTGRCDCSKVPCRNLRWRWCQRCRRQKRLMTRWFLSVMCSSLLFYFEVAIFDVVPLFTDVGVVPIFVVVLCSIMSSSTFAGWCRWSPANFWCSAFAGWCPGTLLNPDAVALNTLLDVQGDVEVVLCSLL